ncbi:MAG: HAMP domain-containing histidine kinase, partial [Gammaproteobacteria bacterium]|nr:HAMP domain-containing histidine kinase [Gammaproteobacteria bacterium]
LLMLINDILDFSKLDSGKMEFHLASIEITPFLNEAISINQDYAKKFNTKFILTESPDNMFCLTDSNRLMQVMSNLMSNAAKFSPEKSEIELSAYIENNVLRINVKDYGPGISEEFKSRLFEKFAQSETGNTRKVGGTGLGLNISKMIMENLGGNLNYTSNEKNEEQGGQGEQGSTFYILLPLPENEE